MTTNFGLPATLQQLCAAGVKALHLSGTITFSPNCGPGRPPIHVYAISRSPICGSVYWPTAITSGPDGALWFTSYGPWLNGGTSNTRTPGYIGRITTSGVVTLYPLSSGQPVAITSGPGDALWFSTSVTLVSRPNTYTDGYIGRITTSGVVTAYTSNPVDATSLSAGPDGDLWFTDLEPATSPSQWPVAYIGQMTASGHVTRYTGSGTTNGVTSIASGPDGALWFTNGAAGVSSVGSRPPGRSPRTRTSAPTTRGG